MRYRRELSGKTPRRSKTPKVKGIFEQVLTEDYWEGYYALSHGSVVKCLDVDGTTASFSVHSLSDGKETVAGTFPFSEDTVFKDLADAISSACGSDIFLRVSSTAENPDRDEEIDNILAGGDRFDRLRIQNLIMRLKDKGINVLGGKLGGKELGVNEYEGFYLLENGKILYCRDLNMWDDSKLDVIVDGVVSLRVLDPRKFSLSASKEQYFGYLEGDRFSDLAESLRSSHGNIVSTLAEKDTELFYLMKSALNGDRDSAAVVSHRLKIDLCLPI